MCLLDIIRGLFGVNVDHIEEELAGVRLINDKLTKELAEVRGQLLELSVESSEKDEELERKETELKVGMYIIIEAILLSCIHFQSY